MQLIWAYLSQPTCVFCWSSSTDFFNSGSLHQSPAPLVETFSGATLLGTERACQPRRHAHLSTSCFTFFRNSATTLWPRLCSNCKVVTSLRGPPPHNCSQPPVSHHFPRCLTPTRRAHRIPRLAHLRDAQHAGRGRMGGATSGPGDCGGALPAGGCTGDRRGSRGGGGAARRSGQPTGRAGRGRHQARQSGDGSGGRGRHGGRAGAGRGRGRGRWAAPAEPGAGTGPRAQRELGARGGSPRPCGESPVLGPRCSARAWLCTAPHCRTPLVSSVAWYPCSSRCCCDHTSSVFPPYGWNKRVTLLLLARLLLLLFLLFFRLAGKIVIYSLSLSLSTLSFVAHPLRELGRHC